MMTSMCIEKKKRNMYLHYYPVSFSGINEAHGRRLSNLSKCNRFESAVCQKL